MSKCKTFIVFFAVSLGLRLGAAEPETPTKEILLKITDMTGGNGVPGKEARTIDQKAKRAVIEDFLRKNPGIRFNAETGIKVPGEAQESAVLMAMAGGSAGELLYVNFRTMDQFVTQNFLYPIDEYVFDWVREVKGLPKDAPLTLAEINPEDIGIHPQVWKVVCRKGNDGIRHCYCIPYGTVVMALVYRKDLFKEAGLDPNKPPKTWDELYDYAYKLTDPAKGQYGIGSDPISWHFIDFLWQGGSECVVEQPDGNWRAVFNDDNAVNTLRFFRKLFSTKVKKTDPETGKEFTSTIGVRDWKYFEDFSRGKCAMYMNYTSDTQLATITDLQPSVLGIAALPMGPVRRANEINAPMWGISSQVKDKAKRDAAWKFIRHQASDDAKRIITKIYVQGGYANTLNPKYLEKFGYTEYLDEIPESWRVANSEAFKYGRPEPYGRNCKTIYLQMKLPLDTVVGDEKAFEKSQYQPGTPEYEADTQWMKKTLDEGVASTNTKLMGLSEETLAKQRPVAWIAVIVMGIIFVLATIAFFKTFGDDSLGGHGRIVGVNTWRHHAQAWIFLSVAVVSIGTWAYLPLIQGSGMAFQDYRVLGGSRSIGLDNFIEAWNQPEFRTSIRVTLVYVALSLGTGFVVPIFLALMLNEVPRCKIVFRVLYNLPAVISGLITIYLWRAFYDSTSFGMLNQIVEPLGAWGPRLLLLAVGGFTVLLLVAAAHFAREGLSKKAPSVSTSLIIGMALTMLVVWWGREWISNMWIKSPPFKWLEDKDTALLSVILPGVWGGAGPGCLIYLAALKAIPEEIYEAADLDGAGAWHKVWYVVLPNLKPLIIINFVGAFIGTFHNMGNILVMTGSGPELSTHVIGLDIWMNAFLYQKYGYATAVAWILGAFLIGFTIWQLRIIKDMKFAANK